MQNTDDKIRDLIAKNIGITDIKNWLSVSFKDIGDALKKPTQLATKTFKRLKHEDSTQIRSRRVSKLQTGKPRKGRSGTSNKSKNKAIKDA